MRHRLIERLFCMSLLSWALLWSCFSRRPTEAVEPSPPSPAFNSAELEFFEKQVRPLFHARCHKCHGPDTKEPKGGLRLDSRAAILAGGDTGPAIQPGDAKESLLIDSIRYGDLYQMPPKSKLPDREIAILTRWVEMGAPWPVEKAAPAHATIKEFNIQERAASHWCWQPPRDAKPPQVENSSWPKQDLDRFILARLEAKQIVPAPPAKRRALIRRVFFDFIGLPPSPKQVEAFVNDTSPRAFEKVVDQLLDSPHFGERWARHWMDLVRYAETYGHEFDYEIPHATEYRDYLIRAFNADVPYDQFVVEHLAGDLLKPRLHPSEGYNESIIGTSFWWLGEATHAPVDVRADEAGRVDNQLDVMSKTFLALTVACARCHDHKFDAISTKDYYSLAGFLQSSRRQQATLDPQQATAKIAQQLQAIRAEADATLKRAIPSMADEYTEQDVARYLLAARREKLAPPPTDIDPALLVQWVEALADPALTEPTHPLRAWRELAGGANQPQQSDFQQLRERLRAELKKSAQAKTTMPLVADFQAQSYDGWYPTGQAFTDAPALAGGLDTMSAEPQLALPGVMHSGALSRRLSGALRSPTFTITHKNLVYRIAGHGVTIRVVVDGFFMNDYSALLFKGMKFDVDTKGKFIWLQQAQDLQRYVGHRAYIEILDQGDGYVAIDEIRFSDGAAPPTEPSPLAVEALGQETDSLAELAATYGKIWQAALQRWRRGDIDRADATLINWALKHQLLKIAEPHQSQLADINKRLRNLDRPLPEAINVLAMTDGSGENERVFIRGNHRTLGEEAPRQCLTALGGEPFPSMKNGSGRLALARQMVDPQNPLTARVMVNRLWSHLLGRGIVGSVDNFGFLGQKPTHPELLDFLALQFISDGWSIKSLIRSIALSSTYQMSSAPDGRGDQLDPQNLLQHRANIRRLQGEAVRDAMLTVSGRLDLTMYGPSVPVHLTDFMQGRGRPKSSGPIDGNGRRSIYTAVRRNFLPPMMLAFDTPAPFNTVGRRNASNVPAQALILMNDPFVVQQANIWAKRQLAQPGLTHSQRIAELYLDAFAREATPKETDQALSFIATQGKELGLSPEAALSDQRVWADLCHVLLNVKEFIFIH